MDSPPDLLAFDAPRSRGGAIKATANDDGTVTLEGICLVFDLPQSGKADLTGEYFTAETYFGANLASTKTLSVPALVDGMFHHGVPLDDTAEALALAEAILPPVTLSHTAKGWLARLVLPMREQYEQDIADLAAKGALGWSTGSAGHAVRKTGEGQITRWPIVECSLTPTPAEPRTSAVPVKSLARPAVKADGDSLTMQLRRIEEAFYSWLRGRGVDGYSAEVYTDSIVAHVYGPGIDAGDGSAYWRIPYTVTAGVYAFAEAGQWTRVERVVSYDPVAKALKSLRMEMAAPQHTDSITAALRGLR